MNLRIKSIKSLRSFGIYENHDNTGCDEFAKFNLIYGWNGSGKSTLSKLFRCIGLKSLDSVNYSTANFSIDYSIEGGGVQTLTQGNISLNPLNIATFNQDFIRDNIDWDKSVKSILLVDQKKIVERQLLNTKKAEKETKLEELKNLNDSKKNIDDETSKFLTKTAKKVKTSLQVIGTEDKKYLNYNKTSLNSLISGNSAAVCNADSLLTDEQTIALTKAATPIEMAAVNFYDKPITINYFDKDFNKLTELLEKSVVNEVIQSLKDNPDIQTWVSTGMRLHNEEDCNTCHFCGSEINQDRMTSLNNHFSTEFKTFKNELEMAKVHCIEAPEITLPSVELFFHEFQDEYRACIEPLISITEQINEITQQWNKCLAEKTSDPFNVGLIISSIPTDLIDGYNQIISSVHECVAKHNEKSNNFKTVTGQHKKKLELHYAAEEVIEFNYFDKVAQSELFQTQSTDKSSEIDYLNQEVLKLEQDLSNETIAADQFNNELCKFLGRTELTLQFDSEQKGYRISRHGSESHAENLSEGEKTAIAFVYFVTKLSENDNDIKKTIVVVDDPVSSFDSNHLFHSYSFLKKHCENALQLFVLTHNFAYFKLVRDWIMKKNVNKRNEAPIVKSRAYIIESKVEGFRQSRIISAGKTLTDYNSEYHYLFSRLHSFKTKDELDLDDVYLCANLSRKLLESFLSFKFPKKRSNFRQLVNEGTSGFPNILSEDVEKIYRFINKYSHNQEIEMEDSADNLLGESPVIINSILDIVRVIDETHYIEMEALVTG
jgi:wobble nucleotide-excising tRNase